jgi:porin
MGAPLERSGNDGFYFLAERSVFQERNSPEQGLSVFARYGIAEDDINEFKSYLGLGAVYTGLFSGRAEDQLGLAVAIAKNGKPFRRAKALASMPVEKRETAIELSYRAPVSPWLTVQPNAHYIVNPGTDPALKNAFVVGLRFEIGFGLQF